MANEIIQFIGQAIAVAQVDTATPANVEVADIFTMTLENAEGQKSDVTYTAAAATVKDVCDGLTAAAAAAKAASQAPWDEVTVTDDDTKNTLTADNEGVPFTLTCTAVDGGGTDTQTLTRAAVTASAGPNAWGSSANWLDDSGNHTLPGSATGQTVHINDASILYDLDQSGITNGLAELHIAGSRIGVEPYADYGDGQVPTFLEIKMAASGVVTIGKHDGPGSRSEQGPVYVDTKSVQVDVTVYNSITSGTKPPVCLLINHASATLTVVKGRVGVGYFPGQTGQLATVESRYVTSLLTDVALYIGSGVTLATLNVEGGAVYTFNSITTVNALRGALTTAGTGKTITTVNVEGCQVTLNNTGTITTVNAKQTAIGGIVDLAMHDAARTITTLKIDPGITLKDNPAVTKTNQIQPYSTGKKLQFVCSEV